jgi:hypothetical protein
MRKQWLLLLIPLLCWACVQDLIPSIQNPSPTSSQPQNTPSQADVADPAAALVGVYALRYYREDSTVAKSTTPATFEISAPKTVKGLTYSASFTVRRDSASIIFVTLTEKLSNRPDCTSILDQYRIGGTKPPYNLLSTGNNGIPVGTKVGTTDGTSFGLDYTYTDRAGTTFREVYTARK